MEQMESVTIREKKETAVEHKTGFTIPQVEFRNILKLIEGGVNDEFVVHASDDGLRLVSVSPDRVTAIIAYINRGCMSEYQTTVNQTFGMSTKSFKGALVIPKNKDALMGIVQNEDVVTLMSADGFTKTVPVTDVTTMALPKIEYNGGGVVNVNELYAAVNFAADVGDNIMLTGDGNSLVVSAKRDEKTVVEAPVPLTTGKFNGEKTMVRNETLKNVLAGLKGFEIMVRIKRGDGKSRDENYPLKINFKKTVYKGEVKGYILIAPLTEY